MATVKLDPAKGIQIPNLTTTERNAISSPETGAIIWNTTTSEINQYNGSAWEITYTDTNTQIAGITSSADATAMTINSSEQIGVGTTTHYDNSTKLTVAGRINTTNGTATGSMNYGGGAVVNMGALTNHPVNLMVNNSTKWVIDTNGNLIAEGGGGIVLGNTSYAAANELDDYEEGTWTVGLRGSTTSGNHTYHGRNGYYTKVGNAVHIQGGVHMNAINTMSGEIYVTGLPFTTGTSGSAFSFSYGGAMSFTAGTTPVGYSVANTTEFLIRAFDATTGTSPLNQSEIGNGTQIIFSGTYFI
jgi:hypothetical protein